MAAQHTHRRFSDHEIRTIRATGDATAPEKFVTAGEYARMYRVHINTIHAIRRFESYAHVEAVPSLSEQEIEASAERVMQAAASGKPLLQTNPEPAPTSSPTLPVSDGVAAAARGFLGEEL